MPARHHVPFNEYPWFQHAQDAVYGVRCLLKRLGLWTAVEQAVNQVDTGVLLQQIVSPNEVARKKVLEGVTRPYNLPADTVLAILDEDFMRSLSYVFREAPEAPMHATTFFGLFRDQNASVWMQSKAQFFWIFHGGAVGNARAFKVLGRYEERVRQFVVYERKQLRLGMGMIAQYTLEHGLYSQEGDELYLHYMLLSRPAQDHTAQRPPQLHMWRCKGDRGPHQPPGVRHRAPPG